MNSITVCKSVTAILFVSTFFASCALFHKPMPGRAVNLSRKSEILEAMQFFSKSRAFPLVDVAPDAHAKAFEFYSENFRPAYSRAGGIWESIGPNNVGGRTLCAAIDPNDTSIVWLGSASGGLWKSTTGGIGANAWTYVETGYPVLGVSSIAIDPTNSNIMYIGTGETYNYGTSFNGIAVRTTRGSHGIGILKSADGGLTWTHSLNWSYQAQRGIWEILINPLNPNVLYAATTEGIYKSNDAGATWTNVYPVLMVMDIEMDHADTNILYAGIGNFGTTGSGLYKTTNSGTTWTQLTTGLPASNTGRIAVSAYAANNKILIAAFSDIYSTLGIYKSVDEGLTWAVLDTTTEIHDYQGWYCTGLLIHPTDHNRALAGGVNLHECDLTGTDFVSIAGGASTSANYVHPDLHGIIANPLDPNKIYIVTDGGLFRSNNFGYNSFECTSGYVTSQFYIGSVSAYDPTIALGGLQDNCTFLYDGIPSWYLVAGGDGCFNAIDPTNDYIMYASEQGLQVYKSIDQGYNFSPCYLHAGYAAFIAPLVMCPSNASVLYAGGDYMIKTTDAGATWTPVGPNPLSSYSYVLSIGVSSTSTDTLYCGMEPWSGAPMKILRSTDGGTSYTDITGSLPDRYPRDMVVNPNNSNEVYVIFSGFGTGHIFKSSDAGASWTDISTTLPDVPFHCMAVNPYNVNMLFAGSDLGVFSSTDGGATWSSFTTGMPMAAMVFDLVVSPSDTTIMAYTHGNGVYKRKMEDAVGMTEATLSNSSIRVFPNPASTEIMVESAQTIQALALYAFNGQHMPNTVVSKGVNTATVDVCKIPGGMYFLVIHAGNGTFTQRIVIGK